MEKNDAPKNSPAASGQTAAEPEPEVKPADYIRLAKVHLAKGKGHDALELMKQANIQFPDHPLILSYYGHLEAAVNRKYRSGIEICKTAISLLGKRATPAGESIHAVLYLNLAKAYLLAGKKSDALAALNTGLKYDRSNSELKKELMGLGRRKPPVLSFLDRSNFLNRLLGMVFHKKTQAPMGK